MTAIKSHRKGHDGPHACRKVARLVFKDPIVCRPTCVCVCVCVWVSVWLCRPTWWLAYLHIDP